jgi:iron(III) transport system substrate-binding protein
VLTSPEAKGKAEMASPLYSGAAAYNVALFADDPAFGWDFWQKLADNGMTVTKGNGAVLKDVASGAKDYGMVVEFIVARAAAEGSPVKFIYPSEGVPAVTEPIALAAKAKNVDAAKKFIDFVLSEGGQEVASQLGYVPIRPGAPVPQGLKGVDDLQVMKGDTKQLFGEVDAAKEKFKAMFKQ